MTSLFRHSLLAASALASTLLCLPAMAAEALRVGVQTEIVSLDPTRLNLGTAVTTGLLFDGLITLDQDRKVSPALAESWSFSDDGKVLTLHLRQGVVFHDGHPLTSADVKFSFDYASKPEVGANILPFTRLVERLETPDDHTVVLHVNGAENVVLDLLDLLFILDSRHPDEVHTLGSGTGPFRLENFEPGQSAIFTRNEDYWGEAPVLDRIEVQVLPDAQSAIAQLRAGTIDFLPTVTADSVTQLSATDLRTGVASPDSYVFDIGVSVKTPPFDDPAVREAVSLAIDRGRIARELGGESSQVKCLPWDARDGRSIEELCPYDPDKARELVSAAGAEGTQVEILGSGQSDPSLATLSQIMQSSLSQIGLDARITELSNSAFVSEFRQGNFELTSHKYGRGSRSPEGLLLSAVVFWSDGNVMGLDNPQYGEDVRTVVTATDPDETTAAAWEGVERALIEERWVLPLATLPTYWASKPGLEGVRFTLDGSPIFSAARFE